jgi:hypothetical protein
VILHGVAYPIVPESLHKRSFLFQQDLRPFSGNPGQIVSEPDGTCRAARGRFHSSVSMFALP